MKKILITGSSGFIGSRLSQQYPAEALLRPSHNQLDLVHRDAVLSYVRQHRPDRIIHTAALSSPGYCQQHPDESRLVNVTATENLALAAAEYGAKLIFFSSDQVYMGSTQTGPHKEEEVLFPSNIYGQHKLEAEQLALSACPNTVCLRASWMYDLPVQGTKTSLGLPGALFHAAQTATPYGMNPKEYRGATWASLLLRQMEDIFQLPGGVYNAGAENPLNSFDTGRACAKLLGLLEDLVIPADYPARNLSMDGAKLRQHNIDLGNTVDGLRTCLASYDLL